MSQRANPALVGGFVLGGAVLAVLAVVVFGSGRLFRDTQTFISFFEGSASGLDVGSAVRFRGIDVGSVRDVLLDLPSVGREGRDLRIAVVYDLDRQNLESRGATARLDDPFDIDTLLALGIRAELATESLVTGRKYIALDLDPERPIALDPVPGVPYPEIPTVTTGLERIEEEAYSLIAQLSAMRLDTLVTVATDAFGQIGQLAGSSGLEAALDGLPETVRRLDATIGDLQALLTRMDSTLTPMSEGVRRTSEQATATLQQLDATLTAVNDVVKDMGGVLEPESPVFVQFERAMTDLSGASRALRDLADYLERNPSALIRGRPGGDQ
ncbi:MAG: MlaD family protein [Gemmatimonadota bacterium]|nr:MlaD family protein [Gemmatimonadota bacterium]MDH3423445.1 MlaD family protein [Gemmatimonadota bacterium]